MGSLLRHHRERKSISAHALRHDDQQIPWAELERRANQRASLYRAKGVLPGDVVSLALPNQPAFIESTFAIWKLGATPNPLPAKLSPTEARDALGLVRPRLLITDADWDLPSISAGAIATEAVDGIEEAPPAPYWRIMASGGSTGRPKLIVDHKPALHDPADGARGQPLDGIVLNPGPLYHSAPFLYSHSALFCGSTLVNMARFDAAETLALIERHRVEWVNFVPTMMSRIWSLPPATRNAFDLSSLQAVWHMAAPMPQWLKRAWIDWLGAGRIWEGYGGTEGIGFTFINGTDWLQRPGSVGRLGSGKGKVRIVGPDGLPVARGQSGDVYFLPAGGAGSTYHYLGAEPRRSPDGWESFGDIGWLDEEDFLFISDRRTDLILRGGANIYPAEVESAIERHPDVIGAAVIGLPDPDLGQVVHAVVGFKPGRRVDWPELHQFVSGALSTYKLPASYEQSSSAIRDEAGKVRRSALREERERLLQSGEVFREFEPRKARS